MRRPSMSDVNGDPISWLLEESNPGVRAEALIRFDGRTADDPEVVDLKKRAMRREPIRSILAAQDKAGWWVKPGPGYAPKYSGTVWNLMFLDQLGAAPSHPKVRRAVEYLLSMTPTTAGGFGCSGSHLERPPPPSAVLHCLNGNLLSATINFGYFEDQRVKDAIEWQARAITGDGVERWYKSGTCGPHFACGANDGNPCGWGAVKAMKGLGAIPVRRRTKLVRKAISEGAEFLLSHDPAVADYPMGYGNTKPSGSWFKLGFPSGYVCDVLEVLEVLTTVGCGSDPRLDNAKRWVLSLQDDRGRWLNRRTYHGKTVIDFEQQGQPSKWVTLRACSVLAKTRH